MELHAAFLLLVGIGTLSSVTGRAVNISNTWVLPEEGFPVFYRYFRDRISWYEADAVCQFHHANLVTVDSTSQYDAIRAYLKELDITEGIWIGLQRNNNKPEFTWMDFHPLSNNEHWQEAIPKGTDALCVAMDPAADYRWHALSCGGPSIASFICELPVPTWASGPKGCLLTELPSLTVLYIPEQSALELTSDCGLDGTKRIACKGNANRDQMVKQLACTINDDFEDKSTKPSAIITQTNSAITESDMSWTSNAADDYHSSTRHRRETETVQSSTESVFETSTITSFGDVEHVHVKALTTVISTKIQTFDPSSSSSTQESQSSSEFSASKLEEISSTEMPESSSTDIETGDYANSISQEQLFTIIENGTGFDVIELNETATEETPQKEAATQDASLTSSEVSTSIKPTKRSPDRSYTSTSFPNQKESEPSKPMKSLHSKNLNDLPTKDEGKFLNKEVEMVPPLPGSPMMKLNRTNRKQLPIIEDFDDNDEIDLDIDNKLLAEKDVDDIQRKVDESEHKTVEVKLHKGDKNETGPVIFVTTKIGSKKVKKVVDAKKEQVKKEMQQNARGDSDDFKEEMKGENPIKKAVTTNAQGVKEIDEDRSKYTVSIDDMVSTTQQPNVTSITAIQKDLQLIIENMNKTSNASSKASSKHFEETSSEKPDVDFQEDAASFEGTGERTMDTPQAQPRPNRQRQLTRNQRKTFYPYFFSRMLG